MFLSILMQETLLSPHLGDFSCDDSAMLSHRSANFPAIISARVIDLLQAEWIGVISGHAASKRRASNTFSLLFLFP